MGYDSVGSLRSDRPMDNILDPAWQLDEKPFHAESLILEDWIPLGMLRQALLILAGDCQRRYGHCSLYRFEDWHEKNGQLTRRQRCTYGDLLGILASDRSLQDSLPQDSSLYWAYYNETHDFLLRYGVQAGAPDQPAIWGDFSFSADSVEIRGAIAHLAPIEGLPLNLIGSSSYFDAIWGR